MAETITPNQPGQAPALPGAFDLLKPSWEAVKINASPIIVYMAITIILSIAASLYGYSVDPQPATTADTMTFSTAISSEFTAYNAISNLVLTLVSFLIAPGLAVALLKGAKGESTGVVDSFKQGLRFFWRYTGLSILTGLIIVLGFILFIVPGFFMMKRYLLAPYYLIDRNLGVLEAMKASAADSKRFSKAIWGIIGVILLFVIIAIVPLLGWIAAIVLSIGYLAAPAIRYLQIKEVSSN